MNTRNSRKLLAIAALSCTALLSTAHAKDADRDGVRDSPARDGTPSSIGVFVMPSLTHARTDTSVSTPQQTGISSDRKLSWGAGAMFDAPLQKHFSIGAGALFSNRKFSLNSGPVEVERTIPTLFVPVEAKFWLANWFSLGAGVFGSVRVGSVKDKVKLGGTTLSSTSSSDHNTLGFGLTASANFVVPVSERTGFLLGARYLYGLTDTTKSSVYDEKIDDLAFNVGLSITI